MKIIKNFWILLFAIFFNYSFANDDILEKVNKYLYNIDTFQANFLQFSDFGDSSEGKFYISRPDKLKFEYMDPFKSILITNGKTTKYYDIEMDELTTLPTKKTPLLFLLKKEKSLEKFGFEILSIEKKAQKIYISTINKEIKELDKKQIAFVFDTKIENLIGINIEDEMKNKLYIEFNNIELNKNIDKNIFNSDFKNRNKKGKF